MFKERLISGIILIAVILALFIAGGDFLWFALIVISLVGINELRRVFDPADKPDAQVEGASNKSGERAPKAVAEGASSRKNNSFTVFFAPYLVTMFYYIDLRTKVFPEFQMLVALLVIALLFIYVSTYPRYHADQVMAALFSFFYVPFMLSYIYLTRQLAHGAYLVWLIILCSWGSDTCAYCVGVLFG
ncbi:MAG: phosphatidate cytidylyltransferase, partial [Lachnospiraceae bacterium]|nr:phosphatidate cytidylyltransferase [Lachnospiraceae bacterium]